MSRSCGLPPRVSPGRLPNKTRGAWSFFRSTQYSWSGLKLDRILDPIGVRRMPCSLSSVLGMNGSQDQVESTRSCARMEASRLGIGATPLPTFTFASSVANQTASSSQPSPDVLVRDARVAVQPRTSCTQSQPNIGERPPASTIGHQCSPRRS